MRHRRKTLSVDPDLLRTIATTFGIEIRGRGGTSGFSYEAALGQVLKHLAQGQPQSVPQTTSHPPQDEGTLSVIKDQAKTLAWLTGRMETLEQQVEQLKQERDEAIQQVKQMGDSAQVELLQLENQRLKQERDEATSKLQAFRQLLMGSSINQEGQTVEKKQCQQPEALSSLPSTQTSINLSEPPKPTRKCFILSSFHPDLDQSL